MLYQYGKVQIEILRNTLVGRVNSECISKKTRTFQEDLQAGNICSNDSKMHANLCPDLSVDISPGVIVVAISFMDIDQSHDCKSTQR